MKNMKQRINFKNKFDAITSVVSAILAITIVILAALSTVFWGIPYIDELRNKESLENAEMQFNLLINNMKDIIIFEEHISKTKYHKIPRFFALYQPINPPTDILINFFQIVFV